MMLASVPHSARAALAANAPRRRQGQLCARPLHLPDFCSATPAEGRMRSPTMWLGIMGGILMVVCLAKRVRASVIIGIALVTIVSWIPSHQASYLGEGSTVPGACAAAATGIIATPPCVLSCCMQQRHPACQHAWLPNEHIAAETSAAAGCRRCGTHGVFQEGRHCP